MTATAPSFTHPRTRELAEFVAERRADLCAAVEKARLLGPDVEASSVRPRLDPDAA